MSAGLDQTEVAKRLGVHRVTVSKWENDAQRPNTEALDSLAELLNVDARELLRGVDNGHESSVSVSRETIGSTDYTPNPTLAQRAPPGAYRVVVQYTQRLAAAGLSHERIDRLERMLLDDRWAGERSGRDDAPSEAQWIERVELIWAIIREALATVGIFP